MRRFYTTTTLLLVMMLFSALLLLESPSSTNGVNFPPIGLPAPSTTPAPGSVTCAASPQLLSLQSQHQGSEFEFGDAVDARSRDDVLRALTDYVYTDYAGAGAITAAFDNDFSKLSERENSYKSEPRLWCQEVNRMLTKAAQASFTTTTVPAGYWSLYMKPSDGSVLLQQDATVAKQPVAKFVFDGRTVMLRLDEHFAPIQKEFFQGPDFLQSKCGKNADQKCPTDTE